MFLARRDGRSRSRADRRPKEDFDASTLPVRSLLALAACSQPAPTAPPAATSTGTAALDVRPQGDTEIAPDLDQVTPELKQVFDHIDEHIDEHVENLQKWIRQPSISNSGEGIPESAEMVKGFFDELGCQQTQIFDVGVTEDGTPGNPVVYAKCDEGAEKTVMIYWMYDTMPVTQPDAWIAPPFEGRIVEQAPYKKVLIAAAPPTPRARRCRS
ncbi:MAG: hypothetical protein R2712_26630 [Vicinamibacterales bacterium]